MLSDLQELHRIPYEQQSTISERKLKYVYVKRSSCIIYVRYRNRYIVIQDRRNIIIHIIYWNNCIFMYLASIIMRCSSCKSDNIGQVLYVLQSTSVHTCKKYSGPFNIKMEDHYWSNIISQILRPIIMRCSSCKSDNIGSFKFSFPLRPRL
jgi:predicted Zn-ribbon and HTH transcriptional regulator